MFVRLLPLAAVLTLLPACDKCGKCQDALDHMASKIEGQACNPNFMQKALDSIEDECKKEHSDWELYVSQMVDQCQTYTASIQTTCSADAGFDHAFPLALVPAAGGGGVSGEAVLLNEAGAEVFSGPWEGEGYTITARALHADETYTFGIRNVGDTELIREVSFMAPQRERFSWSPYAPRTIRISSGTLALENFEVEEPITPG